MLNLPKRGLPALLVAEQWRTSKVSKRARKTGKKKEEMEEEKGEGWKGGVQERRYFQFDLWSKPLMPAYSLAGEDPEEVSKLSERSPEES